MLKTFSRSNPCPICDGGADCRYDTDGNLILCHGHIDFDPDHPDWHFVRPSPTGVWGTFVPRKDERFDRGRWLEQKAERELKARREKEARALGSLSIKERDKAIRSISSYIGLSRRHRQALLDRGLTEEQIKAGLFFTVEPGVRVPAGTPANLAGVIDGKIAASRPGFACITFDRRGRTTGWQVRLDNAEDGNKYRWAKGSHSSHLPNGELPATVINRAEDKSRGWIPEGILKPFASACRHSINCLGVSGGWLDKSPEQVKESVAEYGELVIVPDAGDVANPQVMKRWRKQIAFLKSLGKPVSVAWWGQRSKEDDDIDELSSLDSIALLSPDEFFALALDRQDRSHPECEPDPELYSQYIEAEEERGRVEDAIDFEREREKKAERERKIIEVQKKLNSLTYKPDLEFNSLRFPDLAGMMRRGEIPMTGILGLKGAKGLGKSHQAEQIIALWRSLGLPVISITPRIALGREQAERWGIRWIDESGNMKIEDWKTVGLCFDSMGKLYSRSWAGALVILDESELGLEHLATSGTCRDRRAFLLKVFREKIPECISGGGLVMAIDADLTDVTLNYLAALCPVPPQIFNIVNNALAPRWRVSFYTGKKEDLYTEIHEAVRDGRKLAIATDSKKEAIALERRLNERFKDLDLRIVNIHSDSCREPWGQDFVRRPNESIEREKPDVLIYTPSMGTGVSIDVPWFEKVYGIFFGVISPNQARQMLARIRAPIDRIVWAAERGLPHGGCPSPLPDVVKRNIGKKTRHAIKVSNFASMSLEELIEIAGGDDGGEWPDRIISVATDIQNARGAWNNPHLDLYANIIARKNYQIPQFALCLREGLIEEGHEIGDYSCEESGTISTTIAGIKEDIDREDAERIATAPEIDLETARALDRQKQNLSKEDTAKVTKAFLKDELPGIDLTTEFVYKAVIADRRRWLNAHKLFYYCKHLEITKSLDRSSLAHGVKKFAIGDTFLADFRPLSPQVKLITDLRLFDLLGVDLEGEEKTLKTTDDDVNQFRDLAYFYKHRIYTAFNLTVKKTSDPIYLIKRLCDRVGLVLTGQRVREGENLYREYRLDRESLNDPDRLAVLASLDRKHEKIADRQPLNPDISTDSSVPDQSVIVLNKKVSLEQDGVGYPVPDRLADLYERGRGVAGDFPESDITDLAAMIVSLSPDDGDCWEFLRTFPPRLIYLAIKAIESGRESIDPYWKVTLARAG
jgi:hypothetical protein